MRASAVAAIGAALLFPIRSLGPRPGQGPEGHAVRQRADPGGDGGWPSGEADRTSTVDGIVTVWPEGHVDAPDSPTLLIHYRQDQDFDRAPGATTWTVDDLVAYSKLCTHAGCPVGLYQANAGLLLCPCHQSTFDVLDGARPIFGPAARSLPQLPLVVDDEGELIGHRRLLGPGRPRLLGPRPLMTVDATRKPPAPLDTARWRGGSTGASAPPTSPAPRSTRSSPTTGRS